MLRVKKYKRLNFRSFVDLNRVISENYAVVNFDCDLIVGIPRSGILPASILSLILQKPFCTLNEFLNDITPFGGERVSVGYVTPKNILVVDDSVNSGRELARVKDTLKSKENLDISFKFLTIYATNESVNKVDYYFEIVNNPRVFEWNLIHSWIFSHSCVDIDGVICFEPSESENDDASNYIEFLKTARTKFKPNVSIKVLVTNRLSKYRNETEEWLKSNEIVYDKLVMGPWKSKEERQTRREYASFKAKVYLENKADSILFIESSVDQAIEINKLSKLPVFCTDNMRLYDEFENYDKWRYLMKQYLNKFWKFIGVDY